MASPSPTDTKNKPLPVITLIPKDNDNDFEVDDFEVEELPPIENSVASWSISPDSDAATIASLLERSQHDEGSGRVSVNACKVLELADGSLACGS